VFQSPEKILSKTFKNFEPPPRLTISEWADNFRQLSPESSAEVGQWKTNRAEYLRQIMDSINVHQKVVVMSSSQIGCPSTRIIFFLPSILKSRNAESSAKTTLAHWSLV
jgi:phage terminase large subunit GpA-like protein